MCLTTSTKIGSSCRRLSVCSSTSRYQFCIYCRIRDWIFGKRDTSTKILTSAVFLNHGESTDLDWNQDRSF